MVFCKETIKSKGNSTFKNVCTVFPLQYVHLSLYKDSLKSIEMFRSGEVDEDRGTDRQIYDSSLALYFNILYGHMYGQMHKLIPIYQTTTQFNWQKVGRP